MRIIAIIQCRLSSSRLPAKAALDLHGKPLLARVIERVRMARALDGVVVATSDRHEDDIVEAIARNEGTGVYRGSLSDARDRLLNCALEARADVFLRVTADNPFVEPALLDQLVLARQDDPDCTYAVHDLGRVVHGTASELVETSAFDHAIRKGVLPDAGREHVTTGMAAMPGARILAPEDALAEPKLSLTVDTLEQYAAVWHAVARYGTGRDAVSRIVSDFRQGAEDARTLARTD